MMSRKNCSFFTNLNEFWYCACMTGDGSYAVFHWPLAGIMMCSRLVLGSAIPCSDREALRPICNRLRVECLPFCSFRRADDLDERPHLPVSPAHG
jgi:hypothetical protein